VRERKWTSKELVRNLLRRDRLNGSQGTYVLIRYFRPPILHSFRAPVSPLSRVHELLGTPIPRSDAHCLLDEARHELAVTTCSTHRGSSMKLPISQATRTPIPSSVLSSTAKGLRLEIGARSKRAQARQCKLRSVPCRKGDKDKLPVSRRPFRLPQLLECGCSRGRRKPYAVTDHELLYRARRWSME
jgi:hypothetical protein